MQRPGFTAAPLVPMPLATKPQALLKQTQLKSKLCTVRPVVAPKFSRVIAYSGGGVAVADDFGFQKKLALEQLRIDILSPSCHVNFDTYGPLIGQLPESERLELCGLYLKKKDTSLLVDFTEFHLGDASTSALAKDIAVAFPTLFPVFLRTMTLKPNTRFELACQLAQTQPKLMAGPKALFDFQLSPEQRLEVAEFLLPAYPTPFIEAAFDIEPVRTKPLLFLSFADRFPLELARLAPSLDFTDITSSQRFSLAMRCMDLDPDGMMLSLGNFQPHTMSLSQKLALVEKGAAHAKPLGVMFGFRDFQFESPMAFTVAVTHFKTLIQKIGAFPLPAAQKLPFSKRELFKLHYEIRFGLPPTTALTGEMGAKEFADQMHIAALYSYFKNPVVLPSEQMMMAKVPDAIQGLDEAVQSFFLPLLQNSFSSSSDQARFFECLESLGPHGMLGGGLLWSVLHDKVTPELTAVVKPFLAQKMFRSRQNKEALAGFFQRLQGVDFTSEQRVRVLTNLCERAANRSQPKKQQVKAFIEDLTKATLLMSFVPSVLSVAQFTKLSPSDHEPLLCKMLANITNTSGAGVSETTVALRAKSVRDPFYLLAYALIQKGEDAKVSTSMSRLLNSMLSGEQAFKLARYSLPDNPHLHAIHESYPQVFQKWVQGFDSQPLFKAGASQRLVISDNSQDLLLSGTEVPGSCQSVFGDDLLSKGLQGYVLDGKIKLIAIKEGDRLVARHIMRLMISTKGPVLHLDRLYAKSGFDDEPAIRALREYADQYARFLQVPVAKSMHYPLRSLGGPAAFEYVDAAGGPCAGGRYEIYQ